MPDPITHTAMAQKLGADAVAAYKDGRYSDAVVMYSKYLIKCPDDNIAHYNRGMAYNKLENFKQALLDGDKCLSISPLWAKGYKCKAQALMGLGKLRDAMEVLLSGEKIVLEHADKIAHLRPLEAILNAKLGGYLNYDVNANTSKEAEVYCVVCDKFESDEKDGGTFTPCNMCNMVTYCTEKHKRDDSQDHRGVCRDLAVLRRRISSARQIEIVSDVGGMDLVILMNYSKGPLLETVEEMKSNIWKQLDTWNLLTQKPGVLVYPLFGRRAIPPLTETERTDLKCWDNWFRIPEQQKLLSMMDEASIVESLLVRSLSHPEVHLEDMASEVKIALTDAYTDPLTVFHGMREAGLLRKDLTPRGKLVLHIVGAEPRVEILRMPAFLVVLMGVWGNLNNLEMRLIGPLMESSPIGDSGNIRSVKGTYQEYILSADYTTPTCIVAFSPGLHDGTYSWTPVIIHSVQKNIPFLFTCSGRTDYNDTKGYLQDINIPVKVDIENPFSSQQVYQLKINKREIVARNEFCLVFQGR